jgi:fibronectin type 3 domain-containing protein
MLFAKILGKSMHFYIHRGEFMQHCYRKGLRGWIIGGMILLLPVMLFPALVRIRWNANTEQDLGGYQVYYGTVSKNYTGIIDVGNITSYQVNNLETNTKYYFAVTAYDQSHNESGFSTESSFFVTDDAPPVIESVTCQLADLVLVVFSEQVNEASAELVSNYQISGGIVVQSAELQPDNRTVRLSTLTHASGTYEVTVNNVKDRASVPNTIVANSKKTYSWSGSDLTPPTVNAVELIRQNFLSVLFSEAMQANSAMNVSNYSITDGTQSVAIQNSGIDANSRTVYLTTANHTPGKNYTLTVANVKDGAGNTIAANTKITYSCQASDAEAPDLIAARCRSTTTLELEFDESVSTSTALNTANYSISPPLSISQVQMGSTSATVVLTTQAHSQGQYTVTVKGIGDNAVPSNIRVSDQLSYTYTVPDHAPPQIDGNVEILSNGQVLKVTFNEPVTKLSAEAVTNWSITPFVAVNQAVLDFSATVVWLHTAVHHSGSYTLTVSNIQDQAAQPNTIAGNTQKTYSYLSPDRTQPQLLKAYLHGGNLIELVFSETIDRASSENISNYSILPAVTITSASLVGDSLNHVYLNTGYHTPGQAYSVTVKNILDQAIPANTIDSRYTQVQYTFQAQDHTAPVLMAASLAGQVMLVLDFSEPLAKSGAEMESNYRIAPATAVEEATLDASQKRVFLKTARHTAGVTYTVTVTNVTDMAANPNPISGNNSKSYFCASDDQIPPMVERVEIFGDKILEVCFNEPVSAASAKDKSHYTLSGNLSVQSIWLSKSQMEVFIETTSHQRGPYTITISGIQDLASIPNTLPSSQQSYYYSPADNVPPVLLGIEVANSSMLILTFDEPLDPASVEETAHYSVDGITVNKASLDNTLTQIMLLTSPHAQGNYTLFLQGIQDGSSGRNTISPNTFANYTVQIQDASAPTLVSAECRTSRLIQVTFSEAMDETTSKNKENYKVTGGVSVEDVVSSPSAGSVLLQTTEHAPGSYTLTVNGLKDASPAGNRIADYSQITYQWNPADSTNPALIRVSAPMSNTLELVFSEPVDAVQASKIANYTITPVLRILSAIPDATDFSKVWLMTEPHDKGDYLVTVQNISDRAFTPNLIGTHNAVTYSYLPPDTVGPKLASVEVRTPGSVRLVFDESLNRESAENAANYVINNNVQITDASLLADMKTVTLETSTHNAGLQYTIRITGMRDRAPIPNTTASITRTYMYTPPDQEKPTLVSAKLQTPQLLVLLFSEGLDKNSSENLDNYRIQYNVEIYNASLDTVTMKKVYLETSMHFPGTPYDIHVQAVKDLAPLPNEIDPTWRRYTLETSSGSADRTPPAVARIEMVSPNAVDVVFTEPLDKATAEKVSNYVIRDSITVLSAKLDSNLVRVHLATTPHRYGTSYQIQVSQVRDLAASPNILSSGTATRYIPMSGLALSNLNRGSYNFASLAAGKVFYTDRNYTLVQVPAAYSESALIQTANNDKQSQDAAFLSFDVQGDGVVYVAYDNRIAEQPSWLSGWKETGEQIVDSRASVYKVLSKAVKNGRIVLGGNKGTMDDNMYFVFAAPRLSSSSVLANLNKASYALSYLNEGDKYYIDRDYVLAAVPDTLDELLWIQTANDDKTNKEAGFLKFRLNESARLFIGYDARIKAADLPAWLKAWESFEGQIVDSRGSKFNLFTKDFEPGEVALGGNAGTSDDNMYLVLIQQLSRGNGGKILANMPGFFTLAQNYPNPFNPETRIHYTVHKPGRMTLTIYNVLGQQVRILVDRVIGKDGLEGTAVWDGKDQKGNPVASGVYIYRIQQHQFAMTKRMLLMR